MQPWLGSVLKVHSQSAALRGRSRQVPVQQWGQGPSQQRQGCGGAAAEVYTLRGLHWAEGG